MPRPRFARLGAGRREQILETAAEEFASHGYRGASLNRIIERVGLSKGAFYYYFDGKADLFAAALDHAWSELLPDGAIRLDALTPRTYWPTLRAITHAGRQRVHRKPWLAGFARMVYTRPEPEAAALVRHRMDQARALQRAIVKCGQQLGVVRSDLPQDLLVSVMAAADEAFDRWMLDRWQQLTPAEGDAIADIWLSMFERAFAPPRAGKGGSR